MTRPTLNLSSIPRRQLPVSGLAQPQAWPGDKRKKPQASALAGLLPKGWGSWGREGRPSAPRRRGQTRSCGPNSLRQNLNAEKEGQKGQSSKLLQYCATEIPGTRQKTQRSRLPQRPRPDPACMCGLWLRRAHRSPHTQRSPGCPLRRHRPLAFSASPSPSGGAALRLWAPELQVFHRQPPWADHL